MVRTQGDAKVVRYLVLPHLEPPSPNPPSQASIRAFLRAHPQVENTPDDIGRSLEFARTVLGQRRIFDNVRDFEAAHSEVTVRINFLHPVEWFARLQAEAATGELPFVALIGTTWKPWFVAHGLVSQADAAPYANDVRLLWYWRDMVRSHELRTWPQFLDAAARLKSEGIRPLAVSSSRDADCLWNFDVWLRAAGGHLLFVEHNWAGWRGWHPVWRNWVEADVQSPDAVRTSRALMTLVERDYLALPEIANSELTRDFLDRKMAMVIMEPWVAWQAERLWSRRPEWVRAQGLPASWTEAIGATTPPPIGRGASSTHPGARSAGGGGGTFIGGSLLAVVDPRRGKDPEAASSARAWMRFLVARTAEAAEMETLQFLPASEAAWRAYPHRAFFDRALAELGGDASPAALEKLRLQDAPPPIPEWAPAVERPDVTDQFYWFWKRLDTLPRGAPALPAAELEHRRRLAEQALITAAAEMNAGLSPGQWWVRLLWLCMVAIPAAAIGLVVVQHVATRRKERAWREKLSRDREEIEWLKRLRVEG